MYDYILYLFGWNNDYYKPVEVIVNPSPEVMMQKAQFIIDQREKKGLTNNYDKVIDELKNHPKFKSRKF